jgi:Fe-S cluster biogenesis protein NfuA
VNETTLELHRRAGTMEALVELLRPAVAVTQRVAELVAHVVAAHSAALRRLGELAADPDVLEQDAQLAELRWVYPHEASDADIDRYGNRIESLTAAIDQSATPELATVAGELAGEVNDLCGAALERAFELLHSTGQHDAIRAAIDDDLIASLLVAHDLHPHSLLDRVRHCLDELRETLPEHGGRIELIGVEDDVVRIEITGGSEIHRWRTRLTAERAIERAAPDHRGIEVIGAEPEPPNAPLTTIIPLDAIRRPSRPRPARRWMEVPELAELTQGGVCRLTCDGVPLVACNVGGDLFVALDPFRPDAPNGVRLVAHAPPTVEADDGARLVFDDPFPVQRADGTVEVMVS